MNRLTRIHAADLLRWIHHSKVGELGTDRAEVRMLSFVVVGMLFAQLVEVAAYVSCIDESLTHRVATMFVLGNWALAVVFFSAAAMLLPHLLALAFYPEKLGCQWPRALAARAGLLGAFGWLMLAYLSAPIDYEWLTTVFAARCVVDIAIAIIFGLSLNAQQAREQAAALLRVQRMHEIVRVQGSGNEE